MRATRPVSVVLAAVAVVMVGFAWATGPPDLSSLEAREVAVSALAEAGVTADPLTEPEAVVHRTRAGSDVEVWSVPLIVRSEPSVQLQLMVQRNAGQLVFVDDVVSGRADATYLSDDQFAVLDDYRDDAVVGRWRVGSAAGSVSALGVAAVAAVLASRRAHPLFEESQ